MCSNSCQASIDTFNSSSLLFCYLPRNNPGSVPSATLNLMSDQQPVNICDHDFVLLQSLSNVCFFKNTTWVRTTQTPIYDFVTTAQTLVTGFSSSRCVICYHLSVSALFSKSLYPWPVCTDNNPTGKPKTIAGDARPHYLHIQTQLLLQISRHNHSRGRAQAVSVWCNCA